MKAVTLAGTDMTDVPTSFTRQDDGQLEVILSSKPSTLEGEVRGEEPGRPLDAAVYVFSEAPASWTISSPRTVRSDVQPNGRFSVTGLAVPGANDRDLVEGGDEVLPAQDLVDRRKLECEHV